MPLLVEFNGNGTNSKIPTSDIRGEGVKNAAQLSIRPSDFAAESRRLHILSS